MTQLFTCEEVVRLLWPFLDGVLPESERAGVVAHLDQCAGCVSHHDFARAFLDAVRHAHSVPDEYVALQTRVEAAIARFQAGGGGSGKD